MHQNRRENAQVSNVPTAPLLPRKKGAEVQDVHRRETAMNSGRGELGSSLQISKLAVGAASLFVVATVGQF